MIDIVETLKQAFDDAYKDISKSILETNDPKEKRIMYQKYKSYLLSFSKALKKIDIDKKEKQEIQKLIKLELNRLHASKKDWGL